MKIEKIGTEYIVAEDVFPKVDNRVSEFFFFKDEASAKKFYNRKKAEVSEKINTVKLFNGYETNSTFGREVQNFFILFDNNTRKPFYSLRFIHNTDKV